MGLVLESTDLSAEVMEGNMTMSVSAHAKVPAESIVKEDATVTALNVEETSN